MDSKFKTAMSAKIERWHPWVISSVIVCIAVKLHDIYPIPNLNKEVLAATINISTITIGFLSATQAILLALENKRAILHLKEVKVYKNLVSYLIDSITWSFVLAGVSMFGLLFEAKDTFAFYVFCYYITWLFVLLRMALSSYRIIRIFNQILKY